MVVPDTPDTYPPIDRELLTPCYDDLMPVEPTSTKLKDIITNDVDNHVMYNKCYQRQQDLILEVLIREMDK